MWQGDKSIEEIAAMHLPLHLDTMQSYAHLGRSMFETLWEMERQNGGAAAEAHTEMPGRNDPCPCGSGKKFKRCCLN